MSRTCQFRPDIECKLLPKPSKWTQPFCRTLLEVTQSLPEPRWPGFAVQDVIGLESACRVGSCREPQSPQRGCERFSEVFRELIILSTFHKRV